MLDSIRRGGFPLFALGLAAFVLLSGGCSTVSPKDDQTQTVLPGVRKLVVVGFAAALAGDSRPGWVRDPITGAFALAEPVPREAVRKMTETLFAGLIEKKNYELVSPGQAKGVYLGLTDSDKALGMDPRLLLRKVGEAFSADAVLTGYVFRWVEREGADYGVSQPASVSFNLYMVRPSDGAVLWRANFDKTQQSLSENLFDVATFVKGKGRWMSAEKLAEVGLNNLIDQMPSALPEAPENQNK